MGGTGLATYCLILTADLLADFRYALENISDDGVSVQIELGLERAKSVATKQEARQTHIEDLKELVQVRIPSCDHVFVIPGMEKSSESTALAPLLDLLLYFFNRPAIRCIVNEKTDPDRRLNPRC